MVSSNFYNSFIFIPSKNVTLSVGKIKRSKGIKMCPYNKKKA